MMFYSTHFPATSTRHILQLLRSAGVCRAAATATVTSAGGTRLTPSQQQLRDTFLREEADREAAVDPGRLTADEQLIRQCHAEAVARFHFTYDDPLTGLRVMTRYRHFLRGSCCGNACRHCIYQHENVGDAEIKSKRIFNTAFWTDISSSSEGLED